MPTTLGPSGSDDRWSTYSAGPFQSTMSSSIGSTISRGMPSTRQNVSARSSGSPTTSDSPHEPISVVVTPWRSDSDSAAAISSSAS